MPGAGFGWQTGLEAAHEGATKRAERARSIEDDGVITVRARTRPRLGSHTSLSSPLSGAVWHGELRKATKHGAGNSDLQGGIGKGQRPDTQLVDGT